MLMQVAIFSPNGSHDITFLDNYTNIYIKDALLRTPGVGDINARIDNFSMRIWMDPEKLAAHSLTPQDVIAALNSQSVRLAAGSAGTPPQDNHQIFEHGILVNSQLTNVPDFEKIVVKTIPATGEMIHLKDVARVELGKFTFSSHSFVDGNRASILFIYQSPNSNALETANNVYATLNQLKKSFPEDVDYKVPFETVTIIKVSMTEVVKTLLLALGLVAIVVFLFLQNFRSTIIPLLAIPVSILGTFIFFIPLGFTINTLTMFGFVLAIGIVVDDAIIVVEAVQHYIDAFGMSAKEATYRAMKDISGPIVAIALILASVFVPVGVIPGIVGRLYQQFAITIAISVILSAFIALSLTPALCTLLLKPSHISKETRWPRKFFYFFNNWFEKINDDYTHGVKRCIHGSGYIVILLIVICIGTVFLFKSKPSGFIPGEDIGRLYVTYSMPEGTTTTKSVEVMTKLMKIVASTPGINHYSAISGFNILNGGATSNSGSMFCMLKPWAERTTPDQQVPGIMNVLRKRIAMAGIKDANVVVIPPPPINGIGLAAGFSMQIEQGNTNDDVYAFEKVVKRFVAAAHQNPAISTAFSYYGAHTPSYTLTVDREKCEKLGVNISDVFTSLQSFMGSLLVNQFTLYDRIFYVVVQADTTSRALISDVNKYYVRNQTGQMIPLSTLVSYVATEAPPLVTHFNIFRSAEVDGSTPPGYSTDQGIEALKQTGGKSFTARIYI